MIFSAVLVVLGITGPALAAACPPLDSYYPTDESDWPQMRQQLQALMPECLESAEYFALLGVSQLNSGMLSAALEALERAILLDPDNGGAQIDYAQALYLAGQTFPALEMNRSLLQRSDIPPYLVSMLEARQQEWLSQTRSRGFVAEVGLGYDDNLNRGPSRRDLTLTLSGEPVQLTLDESLQPVGGPYLNLRLAADFQKQGPDYSHDLLAAIRNRSSEHSQSDLLQLDWRYSLSSRWQSWLWRVTAGTSHMIQGGSPLYSVSEARFHFSPEVRGCRPNYEIAAQYQQYHGQRVFSGVETSATAGLECRPEDKMRIIGFEAGLINNNSINVLRPGSDRRGWKLRVYWQQQLGLGELSAQFNLSVLKDKTGYSELLDFGAKREIYSRLFNLRYRRKLQNQLDFLVDLNYQGQGSNLLPFQNSGSALELGLSHAF